MGTKTVREFSTFSDSELLRLMAGGSTDAFREFTSRHTRRVAYVARESVGDKGTKEDIEEVVNDAMLYAWSHAGDYNVERSSVPTWISMISFSQGLMRRRSLDRAVRLRQAAIHEVTNAQQYYKPQASSPPATVQEQLEQALVQLRASSPTDANLVERRFYRQESPTQIAEDLGITDVNARVRLFRAMKKLRVLLAAQTPSRTD